MKVTVSQLQRRRANEAGLMLIELLVVLTVLIALAGILIPQLPNMITRAHTSTSATNMPEANKSIQTFSQIYFKEPANLDNLVSGAALIDYLPDNGTPVGGDITAGAAVAAENTALVNAGIDKVADLIPLKATVDATPGASTTINPYAAASSIPLVAATQLAYVSQAKVQALLRPDSVTGDKFVAFGIGNRSEMTGRVMSEAPVHFDDDQTALPQDKYSRFLSIYKVTDAATGVLDRAQFVGILAMHSDGVTGAGREIGEFFDANKLN